MASVNADLKTRMDELRHEILSYKPGKAVPCDDERVVFPDKLAIGMVDLYGNAKDIVHALRSAVYGDVDPNQLAGKRQTSTEDEDEYLTDSISVIMINFWGTSTSEDNSTGGLGRSDASQSGESPPDDEFADILNQIADDLYDVDKIESLGYQLGIIQGDIERALMTNTKFTRFTSDGTRHMLKQWRIGVSRKDERVKLEKALRAAKLVNLADRYFTKGDIISTNQEDMTDGSRSQHPDQSPERTAENLEAFEVNFEDVSSERVPPVNDMASVSTIRPEEQSSSHKMQDLPEDMSEIAPLVSSGMVGQNKRTAVGKIRRKPKQSKSSNN